MIEPNLKLLQLVPIGVRDYIASAAPALGTHVAAGWKARARQVNQGAGTGNRVVFVPKGPFGAIATVDPGEDCEDEGEARELFSLEFKFAVCFWGYETTPATDPASTSDVTDDTGLDLRHVARCLELFQLTSQALQKNAWGVCEWGSMTWTDLVKEQRHGAELVADLTIRIPILDAPSIHAKPVVGVPHKGPAPSTDH